MTKEKLKQWQIDHRYNNTQLALELGVHPVTVGSWRSGKIGIPRMAELAMYALEFMDKNQDQ